LPNTHPSLRTSVSYGTSHLKTFNLAVKRSAALFASGWSWHLPSQPSHSYRNTYRTFSRAPRHFILTHPPLCHNQMLPGYSRRLKSRPQRHASPRWRGLSAHTRRDSWRPTRCRSRRHQQVQPASLGSHGVRSSAKQEAMGARSNELASGTIRISRPAAITWPLKAPRRQASV